MDKQFKSQQNFPRGIVVIVGLVLVLAGSNTRLAWQNYPFDTLVLVNGYALTESALDGAIRKLRARPSQPSMLDDRGVILQRLIDDELLLQQSKNLGLLTADPGIRKLLVRSAINDLIADSQSQFATDEQLKRFYGTHQSIFKTPKRIALELASFSTLTDAQVAYNKVAKGTSLFDAVAELQTGEMIELPLSLLPEHMLRRYLGASLTSKLMTINNHQLLPPFVLGDTAYAVNVVAVIPEQLKPFEEARTEINSEFQSRLRQQALSDSLSQIKSDANIQVSPEIMANFKVDH